MQRAPRLSIQLREIGSGNVEQKLNMCDSDTKNIKWITHVSHFLPRHRQQKEKKQQKRALTYRKSQAPQYKKCDMRSCALSRRPLFSNHMVHYFFDPLKKRNLCVVSHSIRDGGIDRNNTMCRKKMIAL